MVDDSQLCHLPGKGCSIFVSKNISMLIAIIISIYGSLPGPCSGNMVCRLHSTQLAEWELLSAWALNTFIQCMSGQIVAVLWGKEHCSHSSHRERYSGMWDWTKRGLPYLRPRQPAPCLLVHSLGKSKQRQMERKTGNSSSSHNVFHSNEAKPKVCEWFWTAEWRDGSCQDVHIPANGSW